MLQAERLLMALCEADVAFVVIGGMAAVAQGSSYVTADLDICYQRLSQALRPFKPRLRGAPADLPFVLDEKTLKAGLNFTLTTDGGDLDLFGEVAGLGDYQEVKAHAEEVDLHGHNIWVLTLEGLIASKRLRKNNFTFLTEPVCSSRLVKSCEGSARVFPSVLGISLRPCRSVSAPSGR